METNRSYFRIMPGAKSCLADECFEQGFIGVDFNVGCDLSAETVDDPKQFRNKYRQKYLDNKPDSNKIAAGLACGHLHTIRFKLKKGDIVLSPDGKGSYAVGKVLGGYHYAGDDAVLMHRRPISWRDERFERDSFSTSLLNSAGSIGSISDLSKYALEIDSVIDGGDDASAAFKMENHLEDFLIANWQSCGLGEKYDIYRDGEELFGRQFLTDTGSIDILAVSKDRKELLVVELKRGKAADAAVGQVLRYMAYIREVMVNEDQEVKGCIIAFEE